MCKCFFCEQPLTPIIIEEIGFIIYDEVCKECMIFYEEERYDYEIPDDIFYDNNLDLDLK